MLLVCGPCSAESFNQLHSTAEGLKDLHVDYFRAGLWKPRTRPTQFEGVGEEGLAWMKAIKKDYNMKICTEVATPYMVEKCLEYNFDALWIGARTTQNPFLVEDIAIALQGSNTTIMVKNPLNPDVKLWLGSIERLEKHNIKHIIAVHRGFSLSYNKYRQSPLWRIPLEIKQLCNDIPLLCDPSHIAGDKQYVKEIANNAISTGFDGLMIETHYKPNEALTDAKQQLSIEELKDLIFNLPKVGNTDNNITELQSLRTQINDIDDTIIEALSERMQLSRKIAAIKKDNNITVFQRERWLQVLDKIQKNAKENNLDVAFTKEIYELIHQESIKQQNLIINKSDS